MFQKITIKNDLLDTMDTVFIASPQEEGFLLGCRRCLDHVDCCEQIPAIHAGLHFYTPNSTQANHQIRLWSSKGICFCGIVHSHVVNKPTLSDADIDFARALLQSYQLPVLWFGIGLVRDNNIQHLFYSATMQGNDINISPVILNIDT